MRGARGLCALTSAVILGTILVGPSAVAGGGGCHTDPARGSTAARLTGGSGRAVIDLCAFQPTVLYADEGAEITWVNKDELQHTVTGANLGWGSERFLSQGDTITQRFDDQGVFPFYCLLHPGMVGAVVVGDPDPRDVTTKLSTLDTSGIAGGDQAAPPDPAAAGDAEPASDSAPSSLALALAVTLTLALAAGFFFLRRRSRVEQSV